MFPNDEYLPDDPAQPHMDLHAGDHERDLGPKEPREPASWMER